MLNERMEAEAYLGAIDSKSCRLQPGLLADKFIKKNDKAKLNGLRDVMIVVARAFIDQQMANGKDIEGIHDGCIKALILWCGFETDDVLKECRNDKKIVSWLQSYPNSDCWLRKYYDAIMIESDKKKSYRSWEEYQNEWKKLNSGLVYQVKEYCYENIVADALSYGELKTYFLAIKDADKMLLSIKKEMTETEKAKKTDAKKLDVRTQNKLLKLLAAYLLFVEYEQQKTVSFKRLPFLNWLGIDNDNRGSCFPELTWKDSQFYERISYTDFVKVRVCDEFISEYDLRLIGSADIERYLQEGYSVYKDAGHGKNLNKLC